jgi:O-antigen/teichoic acid export membrane protein
LIVGLLLGTTVLGIYGAITSITVQITALTAMAISPLLPRLSAIWNQGTSSNEENDMQAQLEQATAFNAFVTLGAGSLLFVLAPLIVSFVIPEATTTVAIIAFQVGILIYAIYPLNAVGYYVLFAIGAVRTNLIINLVSGSIALLLISIGAHTAGLLGAILGNVGYVVSLAFVYFGMRYTQIPFSHWVRWITAPLVWFVFVVTSNLLIGERFELRLLLYSAQVVLFVGWFGYYQRQTLLPAINRLRLSNYRWRQQH